MGIMKKLGREKSKVIVDNINDKEMAHTLQDQYSDLSFKAIGILYFLKGKNKEWAFDEKDLYGMFKEGKTAVRSGIKELKGHGIIIEEPYQEAGLQGKQWVLSL